MTNRRTYNDVIVPGVNPGVTGPPVNSTFPANTFQNQQNTFILSGNKSIDNMSAPELRAQNQRLRTAINQWRTRKPTFQEDIFEESGIPGQVNKRIAFNQQKISDLQAQIKDQEQVMLAYQAKFAEFEDNLSNLMRLDKDIHSKLVNPQQSSTLQKNVKNVMVALNSGASYEQIVGMLDSIRV